MTASCYTLLMAILVIATILLSLFLYISYRKVTIPIFWIIAIAIVLRVAMTASFVAIDNNDTRYHREIAELTLRGKNVFYVIDGPRSPYLPFLLYTQAGALLLERNTGIPLLFSLKLFFSMFDVGLVWLLYRITNGNRQAALLYAINPVSILITTVHGQFDIPALFFLFLAIYLVQQKKELAAAISFALGIAWKTWPVLFLIPFVKHLKEKRNLLLVFLIPFVLILLYSIVFDAPLRTILRPQITFRGVFGAWGIPMILGGTLLNQLNTVRVLKVVSNLVLLGIFAYAIKMKQHHLLRDLFQILLIFFIFSPAFGIQWTTWMVPFLILLKPSLWRTLVVVFTSWIAIAQGSWIMPQNSPVVLHLMLPLVTLHGIIGWGVLLLMFLNSPLPWSAQRNILHSQKGRGK